MLLNLKDKNNNYYEINYDIIYKRVRNINMRFTDNNTIVVSAPRYVSKKEIEKVLLEKSDWIISVIIKNNNKENYKLAKELTLNDNEYFFYGIKYDLLFLNENDFNEKIKLEKNQNQNENKIIKKYILIDHKNKKVLINVDSNEKWKKEFTKYETEIFFDKIKFYFEKELKEMNEYHLDVSKIKVKTLKSAWGICHTQKHEITLNRKLVNRKEECMKYVIIHELSHLVYANHSKEFYQVIEKFMPDYKRVKKAINYD